MQSLDNFFKQFIVQFILVLLPWLFRAINVNSCSNVYIAKCHVICSTHIHTYICFGTETCCALVILYIVHVYCVRSTEASYKYPDWNTYLNYVREHFRTSRLAESACQSKFPSAWLIIFVLWALSSWTAGLSASTYSILCPHVCLPMSLLRSLWIMRIFQACICEHRWAFYYNSSW
jgi:hypothetical protein